MVFPGDGGDTTAGNKADPHWVDYSIWGPLFNRGCSSAFYKAVSTLLSNNGDNYAEHMTEINLIVMPKNGAWTKRGCNCTALDEPCDGDISPNGAKIESAGVGGVSWSIF